MKCKSITRLLCLIMVFCLALAPAASAADSYEDLSEGWQEFYKLLEIGALVDAYGLQAPSDEDAAAKAIAEMFEKYPGLFEEMVNDLLSTYDRYSWYVPAGIYDQAYGRGEPYVGIGVVMDDSGVGGPVIERLVSASPAEEAGLLPGDKIVYVGDTNVETYVVKELTALIRGEAGSTVRLGVYRFGNEELLWFDIVRTPLATEDIIFKDMGDGVGYIKIERFQDLATYMDFISVYSSLPELGITSVIFDLRDNPGGSIDVLANMLDLILPGEDETLFAMRDKTGYLKVGGMLAQLWQPEGVFILVNENSASASEVFAGSLQDHGMATLIGTVTYGKGYGQMHIPFKDGSYLVLTTDEMLLPHSLGYDEVGIMPDYYVEMGEVPFEMPELLPLDTTRQLSRMSTEGVAALEQRLVLLGYFAGEPDDVFNGDTLRAVNAYQRDHNIYVTSFCDTGTLQHIEGQMVKLAASTVTVDTQLEKALELALEATSAAAEKQAS